MFKNKLKNFCVMLTHISTFAASVNLGYISVIIIIFIIMLRVWVAPSQTWVGIPATHIAIFGSQHSARLAFRPSPMFCMV